MLLPTHSYLGRCIPVIPQSVLECVDPGSGICAQSLFRALVGPFISPQLDAEGTNAPSIALPLPSPRSALASSSATNTTASDVKGYYPSATVEGMKALHNTISAGLNTVANYVNDLAKGWLILFIGGFVAAVTTALLWLTIMRYFAGLMVRWQSRAA